ncbi:hypothetical protein [Methylobacterium gregans]|uniref:Uncharacterized protein n=1 Tax=Methylobacterium gregans TaxID=374424 RepID=A0AA37MED9_9HYPH|nr:hypothetical protein [Methylobacterium gregans]MDQ0521254.1 hypothetical protein [Methylobacterium gregans]GJD80898.1 hypothetical protein NBEOAGPD_4142 [Methylobacterium gregans]GLS54418.1 hypothetical protein GCM10007886_26010 [Methylobacterium gregans]
MPSLRHLLVDAAAVALVGIGMTAAVSGYLHNLPDPATAGRPDWDEPLTTGSIAPRSAPVIEIEEAETAGVESPRSWADPPLRASRLSRHRPS